MSNCYSLQLANLAFYFPGYNKSYLYNNSPTNEAIYILDAIIETHIQQSSYNAYLQ